MKYCKLSYVYAGMLLAGMLEAQTKVDLQRQGRSADFSQSGSTRPAQTGTSLPTACSQGELFFLKSAMAGQNLYLCAADNAWTVARGDLALPNGQSDGLVLTTNGSSSSSWRPLGGDVSGTPNSVQVQKIRGQGVSLQTPVDGDILKWNASTQEWTADPTTMFYTAGYGIVIAGSTIALEEAIVPLYSAGTGAPTTECMAGRDIYTDTASARRWFCSVANTWQELALEGHTHAATEMVTGVLDPERLGSGAATGTTFLAGDRTWKAVAATEVTGLAASATADTTNANNITSGTLDLARGGTAQNTWVPSRCVQIAADGTQLESAPAECGPGAGATGAYSALLALTCSASNNGLIAVPQDSSYDLMRCDGAGGWEHFANGRKLTPPPNSGWNWLNQGTATVSWDAGTMDLDLPVDLGTNAMRAEVRTVSLTPPWQLRTLLQCGLFQSGNACGLVLHETASGRLILFGLAQVGSNRNHPVLTIARYESSSAAPTAVYEGAAPLAGWSLWLEIRDDGIDRRFYSSAEGRLWHLVYSEPSGTFLAANEWGAGGEAVSALAGPTVSVIHWEVR